MVEERWRCSRCGRPRGRTGSRPAGSREQPGWDEHARFADGLVVAGIIVLGGPISGADDEDIALLMVEAAGENEIRAAFADDPWTTTGVFRIKAIWPWTIWLDARQARARS
jgi:uncharacterized protein YciI